MYTTNSDLSARDCWLCMSWDVVLFDLDGTLTDSGLGVGNGVLYALAQMGFPKPDDAELRKYLGPPLWTSFSDYAGMDETQTIEAVRLYREYYNETGAYENSVYSGIPELLAKLVSDGKRLAVATSKVDYAAVNILQHFNLDHFFDVIAGSDETGELRGTKALVIEYALAELRMCDGSSIVMIGDREHDILGAKEHGLPGIGVLYGYGDLAELESAGAVAIVSDVADLELALYR
ncbi:MAG: HAD-IA family hydrolase [Actinobacteria bacterium]|nr:HAD-IA family hydrolase [Actinomycetota bacterium]MSW24063.1 HAD-IA family hydrolase [Actinomycetota bacterium]MSX29774.1 HAD-IA family hydrolase [Actinomycetota bacterium]MSX43237.1 HAD-IA family hydrolase [Actinomycetota bacterium]MSX97693.1 HAD-IA family hydrolase [Actinomycetota bacterium]